MTADLPEPVGVPVDGGDLAAVVTGPADGTDPARAPAVLLVHGITATHRSWPFVADLLPAYRLIAPDLRGRGRSNALPAPYGMQRHAADLVALLDAQGVDRVTLVGHSMGGFVVVALAERLGERVAGVVLVDGGLPLPPPPPLPSGEMPTPADLLGPAAERLTMVFESHESYRAFWRQHPALAEDWSAVVEAYVDYDLQGEPPELRPSTTVEAMMTDAVEIAGSEAYDRALAALGRSGVPVTFVRAPRGLMNGDPLYPGDAAAQAATRVPQLRGVEVDDVNHYTLTMGERGAGRVAAEVRAVVEAAEG